jgi:thymidine kinase
MKSGKTSLLVWMAESFLASGDTLLPVILSPNVDTRSPLARHDGARASDAVLAIVRRVSAATDYAPATAGAQVVLVDEAQFLPEEFVPLLDAETRSVFVFGLDVDYRGRPFGIMPQLLALATDVEKMKGRCAVPGCQSLSTRTRRLGGGDDLVVIGEENYGPRCLVCFRAQH